MFGAGGVAELDELDLVSPRFEPPTCEGRKEKEEGEEEEEATGGDGSGSGGTDATPRFHLLAFQDKKRQAINDDEFPEHQRACAVVAHSIAGSRDSSFDDIPPRGPRSVHAQLGRLTGLSEAEVAAHEVGTKAIEWDVAQMVNFWGGEAISLTLLALDRPSTSALTLTLTLTLTRTLSLTLTLTLT